MVMKTSNEPLLIDRILIHKHVSAFVLIGY